MDANAASAASVDGLDAGGRPQSIVAVYVLVECRLQNPPRVVLHRALSFISPSAFSSPQSRPARVFFLLLRAIRGARPSCRIPSPEVEARYSLKLSPNHEGDSMRPESTCFCSKLGRDFVASGENPYLTSIP